MKAFVPKISLYEFRNKNSFRRKSVNPIWHGTEVVPFVTKNMGFSTQRNKAM